jgi:dephospho-CoA kinase
MLKVALTGNIASGKSLVAGLWADAGVAVVSADDLARDVVAPGTPGLQAVVDAFGDGILKSDGTLNRAVLRVQVFADARDRARLEAIVHPRIRALRQAWVEAQEKAGANLIVSEVPLLFEAQMEGDYDAVVVVTAPRRERLRRLWEGRGMSEPEALSIMATQIPSDEKEARADYVLDNGGSREDLEIRAMALLDLLRARARREAAS